MPDTMLIVENDPTLIYLLRCYAHESGYQTVSTSLSKDVLTMARRNRPAVIVLDADLPNTGEQEVLRSLKAEPATQSIPVVVCSWKEREELAQAEDAAAYLQKPLLYRDFVAALVDAGVCADT